MKTNKVTVRVGNDTLIHIPNYDEIFTLIKAHPKMSVRFPFVSGVRHLRFTSFENKVYCGFKTKGGSNLVLFPFPEDAPFVQQLPYLPSISYESNKENKPRYCYFRGLKIRVWKVISPIEEVTTR